MKQITKFWVGVTLCCLVPTSPAQAQIVPDTTLGARSSVVKPDTTVNGRPSGQINGGARRGANLFHSFREFNIGKNQRVYFTNPVGVENILSRVTGNDPSNVLGTLGVTGGNANLFLFNPNGIIFGPDASLDIGGSFVASTASSLNFANGTQFSATAPQTTPLLTVSVPIGLQFGRNPGEIINQSRTFDSSSGQSVGLQVKLGRTLALVGGDLTLDGGSLRAPGGRVELGGVAGAGTVGLNGSGNDLGLSFPALGEVARANVSLINDAGIDVTAGGGGSIAVNARNIGILDGSLLNAGIASGLEASRKAGDITLNATGAIRVTGDERSYISNTVNSKAKGNAGNINITTGTLWMNNAELRTDTSGQGGKAGNISVHTSDSVSLENSSDSVSLENSNILTTVNPRATGDGGDITITTGSLWVNSEALLSSSTNGKGNAGSVTINAETVSFKGGDASSGVQGDAVGDGGDITITTGSLSVVNGAQLLTSTNAKGNAGNVKIDAETVSLKGGAVRSKIGKGENAAGDGGTINITTGSLSVMNGARIEADTAGQGNAGSVTVNAETVSLEGGRQDRNGNLRSSGIIARVGENAVGDGGTINIITGSLSVMNGARIEAGTSGQGSAGSVTVNAETVSLEGGKQDRNGNLRSSGIFSNVGEAAKSSGGNITLNTTNLNLIDGAEISAKTALGDGGNINLQVQELLLLRRGSSISTTAGTTQAGGNGGMINIDAPLIFAIPSENSNISANASIGNGGSVEITTQSIFGIEFREETTLLSDITASSEFGVSGTVNINTLNIDPSQGLVTLPEEVTDASGLIARDCSASEGTASGRESKFVVTGRGGLPPNPNEPLSSDTVLADWVTLDPKIEETSRSSPVPFIGQTGPTPAPTVEAQGWSRDSNDQVVLTAQAPTVTPHSPGPIPTSCRGF